MKKSLLFLMLSMLTLVYGCSEESEKVGSKKEVVEEVKKENIEPSGLKVTKEEFIDKFNTSVEAQNIDDSFKIDNTLQSEFGKFIVIENEDGYIEHLTYLFDTFAPAPQIKLLLSVFSPLVAPENLPGIINFDFGLYEDHRDMENKFYSGKSIIGTTVYELQTNNVANREFEITIRQYTGNM